MRRTLGLAIMVVTIFFTGKIPSSAQLMTCDTCYRAAAQNYQDCGDSGYPLRACADLYQSNVSFCDSTVC